MPVAVISLRGYKFANTNGLRTKTINIIVMQGISVNRVETVGSSDEPMRQD